MNLMERLLQLMAGTQEAKKEADRPTTERRGKVDVPDSMVGPGPVLMDKTAAVADKAMLDALALDRKEKHGYEGAGERLARYSELAAKGNKGAQEFLDRYGLGEYSPAEIKSWYAEVTKGLESKPVPK
jgi:hypothetical protein